MKSESGQHTPIWRRLIHPSSTTPRGASASASASAGRRRTGSATLQSVVTAPALAPPSAAAAGLYVRSRTDRKSSSPACSWTRQTSHESCCAATPRAPASAPLARSPRTRPWEPPPPPGRTSPSTTLVSVWKLTLTSLRKESSTPATWALPPTLPRDDRDAWWSAGVAGLPALVAALKSAILQRVPSGDAARTRAPSTGLASPTRCARLRVSSWCSVQRQRCRRWRLKKTTSPPDVTAQRPAGDGSTRSSSMGPEGMRLRAPCSP
mmetsp:Transcript_31060/g.98610  ORF Transcript_31060/g.98610 Transcript_31060/m.98610 type:complete len:265 (+) Transcript_31060:2126-2920(+)